MDYWNNPDEYLRRLGRNSHEDPESYAKYLYSSYRAGNLTKDEYFKDLLDAGQLTANDLYIAAVFGDKDARDFYQNLYTYIGPIKAQDPNSIAFYHRILVLLTPQQLTHFYDGLIKKLTQIEPRVPEWLKKYHELSQTSTTGNWLRKEPDDSIRACVDWYAGVIDRELGGYYNPSSLILASLLSIHGEQYRLNHTTWYTEKSAQVSNRKSHLADNLQSTLNLLAGRGQTIKVTSEDEIIPQEELALLIIKTLPVPLQNVLDLPFLGFFEVSPPQRRYNPEEYTPEEPKNLAEIEIPEYLTQESLDFWSDEIKDVLGLWIFHLSVNRDGSLILHSIIVRPSDQKRGKGTTAMIALTELADQHQRRIWLTPGERDPYHKTTSRARLIRFYKRFGFVMNKGRNKDYRYRERMYRRPIERAKRYRRNADLTLRQAERAYKETTTRENLRILNSIRYRAGLPIIFEQEIASPEAAYGAYIFYLFHGDGTQADELMLKALDKIIETGPTPWPYGLAIDSIPEARQTYLGYCQLYGVEPEATDADSKQRRFNPDVTGLEALRSKLCVAAQEVYDGWVQDEDGYSEENAHGGICHNIADSFCDVLSDHEIDCTTFSQSMGEVHVYAVAGIEGEAYRVDIYPYTYEQGGGYTWRKIPDVIFEPHDIIIEPMGYAFEDYLEEY